MGYFAIAILAAILAYFQYFYKANDRSPMRWFLAFLRFAAYGLLLLLLFYPLWVHEKTVVDKQPLVLALDNSQSIAHLKQTDAFEKALRELTTSPELNERFRMDTLWLVDSTRHQFTGLQSPLAQLGQQTQKRYGRQPHQVVLLTDGNTNQGEHPAYSFSQRANVYPLVVGDTTRYEDLAIAQLNVNRYAFWRNQFPVEVLLQYQGLHTVQTQLVIKRDSEVLHRENITLSPSQPTQWKEVLLQAHVKGKQRLTVELTALPQEKVTLNNSRHFGVEVLDQRAKIALVSAIVHPDLSALRQSLQQDGQREVTLYKPTESTAIAQADLQIWYQPTAAFAPLVATSKNQSLWVITGNSTDFNWLNAQQLGGEFKVGVASEQFKGVPDAAFSLFTLPELNWGSFAPLSHPFGQWRFEGNYQTLLHNQIGPVQHQSPMLAVASTNPRRIFWMGEGAWQWRLQHFANAGSFDAYAQLMGKLAQYATVNQNRERLILTHQPTYYQGEPIVVTAQTFNANYELVTDAQLQLQWQTAAGKSQLADMRLQGDSYTQTLPNLAPGRYVLTLVDKKQGLRVQSNFEVMPFNLEQLAQNADYAAMQEVAVANQGQVFLASQTADLIQLLLQDEGNLPRERTQTLRDSLLDKWWMLVLIAALLATEWFIRKYRGWM